MYVSVPLHFETASARVSNVVGAREFSVRHAVGMRRLYDATRTAFPLLRRALDIIGRDRVERIVVPVERVAKSALFDCRMCGQCALSSTGMSCPMNCAKSMRNGPCGGVRPDQTCEVVPSMRCVWVAASEGQKRLAAHGKMSAKARRPLDHRRRGSSSWVAAIAGEAAAELPCADRVTASPRIPFRFEQACQSRKFVLTVEIAPPDTADPSALLDRAGLFHGLVDAINITDGAGANCHMSSVAASALLAMHGLDAIHQMTCRDRNRIAMQGDLLGASALGVRNVLCLTGDDVSNGDQPEAKRVFDLDSVSLLRLARHMRDRGEFSSGRKLIVPPNIFLGATVNPFAPPYEDRIANLAAKIEAGAQFIQTQFCYDLDAFSGFLEAFRRNGLHERCALIVGVGALNNAKALERMVAKVPGVHVPKRVIDRIGSAPDQRAEGLKILIETMESLAGMAGVAGAHLMGFRNEPTLAEALRAFGARDRA